MENMISGSGSMLISLQLRTLQGSFCIVHFLFSILYHRTVVYVVVLFNARLSLPLPRGPARVPWEPTQDQLPHSRDWPSILFITIKMSNGFKKFIHLSPVPPIKSIKLFEVQSPNEDKSKSVFEYKVVSPTIKTSDSLGANFD